METSQEIRPIEDMGAVKHLSILPLIDFYADDEGLETEAGVSYLIRADETTVLLDLGLNQAKAHPSFLLRNMERLGISTGEIDMIFISHCHLDHVGGMAEQKNREFSFSAGPCEVPEIPAYTPLSMSPSSWNPLPRVRVLEGPCKLAKGIAGMGPMDRNLFLIGPTREQSLAVHVEGKGMVLIIGCGHPTIERILDRAHALFAEPVYGIVGGLHFPVNGGRIMMGPLNMQNIVGTEKMPWHGGIREEDVMNAIERIRNEKPGCVALSPHDSSDWSIEQFRKALGDVFQVVRVGQKIVVESA